MPKQDEGEQLKINNCRWLRSTMVCILSKKRREKRQLQQQQQIYTHNLADTCSFTMNLTMNTMETAVMRMHNSLVKENKSKQLRLWLFSNKYILNGIETFSPFVFLSAFCFKLSGTDFDNSSMNFPLQNCCFPNTTTSYLLHVFKCSRAFKCPSEMSCRKNFFERSSFGCYTYTILGMYDRNVCVIRLKAIHELDFCAMMRR